MTDGALLLLAHVASNLADRRAFEACYRRVDRNQSSGSRFIRSHLPILRGTSVEIALETPTLVGQPPEDIAEPDCSL